jgi:hypothetical protein
LTGGATDLKRQAASFFRSRGAMTRALQGRWTKIFIFPAEIFTTFA